MYICYSCGEQVDMSEYYEDKDGRIYHLECKEGGRKMKKYTITIEWEKEVQASNEYEAETKAYELWKDDIEPLTFKIKEA